MDTVEVLYQPQDAQTTAKALLEAAGDDQESVRSISGGFVVPTDVAARAGFHTSDDDVAAVADEDTDGQEKTDPPVTDSNRVTGDNSTDGGNDTDDTDDTAARDAAVTAANAETPAAEQTTEPLHGKALDTALDAADLSKAGTVAEKQARLAEYQARLAAQAQL